MNRFGRQYSIVTHSFSSSFPNIPNPSNNNNNNNNNNNMSAIDEQVAIKAPHHYFNVLSFYK